MPLAYDVSARVPGKKVILLVLDYKEMGEEGVRPWALALKPLGINAYDLEEEQGTLDGDTYFVVLSSQPLSKQELSHIADDEGPQGIQLREVP